MAAFEIVCALIWFQCRLSDAQLVSDWFGGVEMIPQLAFDPSGRGCGVSATV